MLCLADDSEIAMIQAMEAYILLLSEQKREIEQ
jgi:hypothetical protein